MTKESVKNGNMKNSNVEGGKMNGGNLKNNEKLELRVWLRLLGAVNRVEGALRGRMRQAFDSTLPRFDVLAQLARRPEGLSMGDLSRRLMVSNGNVTDVMARLEKDGMVRRTPSPADRRTVEARLTPAGEQAFGEMAESHGEWIATLFSGLDRADLMALIALMDTLRASLEQPGGIDRRHPAEGNPAEGGRAS